MRFVLGLVAMSLLLVSQPSWAAEDELDAEQRAQWRHIFDNIAADYQLVPDSASQSLELVDGATYTWARSGPHGGTYGAVYVWMNHGNAESVACFWRNPGASGVVSIVHELHSLSPVVRHSLGKDSDSWKPKAGVKRYLLAEAPTPAATSVGRIQQMRALCRDFSAHSVSVRGDRTELRLLPQPLYRYKSTDPNVLDGAL